jgi:hypothetical protein
MAAPQLGFPYAFPFPLPGTESAPAPVELEGIDPIASSAAVAFEKLATYLKTNAVTPLPNVAAVLQVFCNRFDEVEAAFQELFSYRQLANAANVPMYPGVPNSILLDNIGQIVGLLRGGLPDATYQLYLSAQIAANNSSGTTEDINLIFGYLVPAGATWRVEWQNTSPPGAACVVYVTDPDGNMTADIATAMAHFLQEAKGGGIRAILEYSTTTPDAGLFSFMSATDTLDGNGSGPTNQGVGLDQGAFRGALN